MSISSDERFWVLWIRNCNFLKNIRYKTRHHKTDLINGETELNDEDEDDDDDDLGL